MKVSFIQDALNTSVYHLGSHGYKNSILASELQGSKRQGVVHLLCLGQSG